MRSLRCVSRLVACCAAVVVPATAAAAEPQSLSQADLGKLVEALRGEPQRPMKVRLQAALIASRVGGAEAVPALLECLDEDPEYAVRAACALALGNLGDIRAVEPLVAHLDDEDELVRRESRESLLRLARPEAMPYLQAARERGSTRVRLVLAEVAALIADAHAGVLLAELLGDPDDQVRARAEAALQTMAPEAASALLLRGLEHPNYRVKAQSARLLGARQHAAAIDRLVALAASPLEAVEVQAAARSALRQMRVRMDVEQLATTARDRGAERQARSRALVLLAAAAGPDALQACIDVLNDSDESMRGTAAQALAEMGDPRALPALREALARNPNDRAARVVAVSIRKLERGSD